MRKSVPSRFVRKLLPLVALLPLAGLVDSRAQTADAAGASTTWEHSGWGGGGFFYCAAYHPAKDGTIYMGGDVGGAYKTEDHGLNWKLINNGLASYGVFSLAVDQRNPDTVYAATEGGLCKSTDAGETWVTLPRTDKSDLRITGEKNKSIHSVAVDPSNGSNVYATSPLGKVYKSTDGGQTWAVAYEEKTPEEEPGVLRVQYGKVNNAFFGALTLMPKLPAGESGANSQGIGFTFKGDGTLPKDSFFIMKTKDGIAYRSKNLNTLYQNTNWSDVVLKASDFVYDPQYLKAHPEAASQPVNPDFASIARFDLTCSGPIPTTPAVARLKRFYLAFAPAGGGSEPRLVPLADFSDPDAVKAFQTAGNIHLGDAPASTFYSVAVAPSDPSRVVVATAALGLVMSKDAGKTWKELQTPTKASSAAFDPKNPDIIYGSFFADGVMKSTDGGATWKKISDSFPDKFDVLDIAVNPANPLNVCAIGKTSWTGVFLSSEDGGNTWQASGKALEGGAAGKYSNKIDLDEASGNPTMDMLSADGKSARLSAPTNIAINPLNPSEIFLSANWRPSLSTDGGTVWTERCRGADISCITDIRFHKGKVYASAMDEGSLVSSDNGKTWKQLWPLKHTDDLSGHNWRLAVNDVNGGTRVISTCSPWSTAKPQSIIRSEDDGNTFTVIREGIPNYVLMPNTMWGRGYPRALAVDPNDPQVVYLGIDGDPEPGKMGGGIFKSLDGGATWKQLTSQPTGRRMYNGLAVDPTDSNRVFWGACGNGGGVWRSNDGGESWEQVFRNEVFVWNVVVATDGTIYCSGEQLWRSKDQGKTWTRITNFPEKPRAMVGIEVHPTNPNIIWVSRTNWGNLRLGSIHKTTDGGDTWTDITGNIPYVGPQTLRFNPETNELWAGWAGMFKTKQ
ncbi:hypothetical protein TSACC_2979 [Terrimicrobium sacchariphilum]|uniref:Sortilin N-terminal domain-containing protein n=1 Tax=Terrimicrobium sacchariphilum TaxID=690879 RepID=A0A146G4N0_TERSA|nr:hypothetical protein [Terrimicrobium sacchariphilum]GAT32580.1 hypothetical protein TSACC_2979 [Terrimicrobium sacchariphilum]